MQIIRQLYKTGAKRSVYKISMQEIKILKMQRMS